MPWGRYGGNSGGGQGYSRYENQYGGGESAYTGGGYGDSQDGGGYSGGGASGTSRSGAYNSGDSNRSWYHYTSSDGLANIAESGRIMQSHKYAGGPDAVHGSGVYVSGRAPTSARNTVPAMAKNNYGQVNWKSASKAEYAIEIPGTKHPVTRIPGNETGQRSIGAHAGDVRGARELRVYDTASGQEVGKVKDWR